MRYIESQHQIAIFKWARHPAIIKQYPEIAYLYAAKNTQKLNPMQASRHKAMGSLPGIPDIHLPVRRERAECSIEHGCEFYLYCGLWIELKKPKDDTAAGKISMQQNKCIEFLRQQGYMVMVCYSANEAIKIIENYLKGV